MGLGHYQFIQLHRGVHSADIVFMTVHGGGVRVRVRGSG